MVADTRKMYELKLKLCDLLKREYHTGEMFNALVEANLMSNERLEKYIKLADCPELQTSIEHKTKEEIMDNPYLKDIAIPSVKVNNIKLDKKRIVFANTISPYREKARDIESLKGINSYYVCDRTLRFPSIVEGETNVPWMTVEPSEIASFEPFVNEAQGNVLLCGCGLGYVAYMLSLKSDVESITIVELNEDIIRIFEEHILPQFKNKDKVKVIQADAIEYLQNNDLSNYNYVNVDIWRDTIDMSYLYLPCLAVEAKYPSVVFSYWLEPEMKAVLQKSILRYIADFGDDQPFYKVIAKEIVDTTEINNLEDIKKCVALENMREVLLIWYMNNLEKYEELKKESQAFVRDIMQTSEQIMKKMKERK